MARCLLHAKDLLTKFWAEVVYCENYLLNQILMREVYDVTPIKKWCGKKLSVSHLRTFGCVSWVHILDDCRKKLDEKSHACITIGYSEVLKAYRLFNPVKQKIIIRNNVIFDEKNFGLGLLKSSSSLSYNDLFGIIEDTRSIVPFMSISISSLNFVPESTSS